LKDFIQIDLDVKVSVPWHPDKTMPLSDYTLMVADYIEMYTIRSKNAI
jgi:hypothetical protein